MTSLALQVRTTDALIAAVGLTLLANRGSKLLGIASAVALGAADVIFVAKGRISKVYLVDAAAEAAFTAAWISG